MVQVGLPPCFGAFVVKALLHDGNVLPVAQSAEVDEGSVSPWKLTHGSANPMHNLTI